MIPRMSAPMRGCGLSRLEKLKERQIHDTITPKVSFSQTSLGKSFEPTHREPKFCVSVRGSRSSVYTHSAKVKGSSVSDARARVVPERAIAGGFELVARQHDAGCGARESARDHLRNRVHEIHRIQELRAATGEATHAPGLFRPTDHDPESASGQANDAPKNYQREREKRAPLGTLPEQRRGARDRTAGPAPVQCTKRYAPR